MRPERLMVLGLILRDALQEAALLRMRTEVSVQTARKTN
jgi:hypothetical protein